MISEREWAVLHGVVEKVVAKVAGRRQDYFTTGTVIKSDTKRKLVWLKEFGDQAVPIVAFNYDVTYYDTDSTGVVHKKKARATVRVPKRGEKVVVASEWGIRRLPRCIGVIQGKGWMSQE